MGQSQTHTHKINTHIHKLCTINNDFKLVERIETFHKNNTIKSIANQNFKAALSINFDKTKNVSVYLVALKMYFNIAELITQNYR